jgi:hypothetical protein
VLVIWYFLPHVLGHALFIGDSDRMGHFFTWLLHLNDGVRHGYLPTWNESLFGGYSTVGLPYVYYNPLGFVGLLFPRGFQLWVAGWTSMLWLWLAGLSAYAFIRLTVQSPFYAFVGAALYESSAVAVLKISQNEGTFSVVALTPILLLSVDAARPQRLFRWVLLAFFCFAYLFSVSFLQEAAYACMLVGFLVVYRVIFLRVWAPVVVVVAAGIPALLVSLPRIINVGTELALSNRSSTGGFGEAWRSLGAFNSFEILRLLDDRILGRYFSHALALGNAINLHEGMVAYLSTYALVVLIVGALWYAASGRRNQDAPNGIPFYLVFAIFCLSVPITMTGYRIMYYLFLQLGFIHARVTTVAMPPLCLLVSTFLQRLDWFAPSDQPRGAPFWVVAMAALASGVTTGLVEVLARPLVDVPWPIMRHGQVRAFISEGAVLRVVLSIVVSLLLLSIAFLFPRYSAWRGLALRSIGLLAVMQLGVYAKDQISGDFMYSHDLPYRTPTRLLASADEFRVPSQHALARLHEVLRPELYRTAIVCDPSRISIYCTPYVANLWGLREIGGYISSIPQRISALPWPTAEVGLRSIVLPSTSQADWDLLALLNVKYVVEYHPALLTNAVRDRAGRTRELAPEDLVIHENPRPVVPRVYLARRVVALPTLDDVRRELFPAGIYRTSTRDVQQTSYVEGPPSVGGEYAVDGQVHATFRDQFVDVELTPSDRARFLVVNERYHPEWRAYVDGRETPIFPTNVFMRGLVLPAYTRTIRLHFEPFGSSRRALPLYFAGVLLAAIALAVVRRADHVNLPSHGS